MAFAKSNRLRGYKTFFPEHDIFSADKYKKPTTVGIFFTYKLRNFHTQLN